MSFLGILKDIVGIGGAPFTGGASLAAILPDILSTVGTTLAGATKGAASGRAADANLAMENQRLAQTGAGMQLQQAQALQSARQQALANLIRGGLLSGMQDASVSNLPPAIAAKMPTLSGGARPSAIAGASGIGDQFRRDALQALLDNPDPTKALQNVQIPGAATLPQESGFMKFLDIASPIAGILGAVGQDLRKKAPAMGTGPSVGFPSAISPSFGG